MNIGFLIVQFCRFEGLEPSLGSIFDKELIQVLFRIQMLKALLGSNNKLSPVNFRDEA